MKKKLLALLLAFSCLLTPVFAEDIPSEEPLAQAEQAAETEKTEESAKKTFTPAQQQDIIRYYGHLIADSYFYGVSDNNLLYAMLCATIDNGGQFDLDLALKSMIDFLDDDYAEYYPPEVYESQAEYFNGSFIGIGVVLAPQGSGTVVDSVYVGGGAENAGIISGDVIIAVDGVDTSGFAPAQVRELIVGEDGTTVKITVRRGEEVMNLYAVRGKVEESHSSMKLLNDKTAYIGIESFTGSLPGEFDKYIEALRGSGVKNMIIDLRDNGGGDLEAAISVAQKLIPAGYIAKIKRMKGGSEEETVYSENLNAPDWKMLVLVNENTASAAEFLAMALQSRGRAKLMGTQTYGKGCMQAVMRTPTGSGLKFTVGEYFSINDERINTVGLTPDIEVENIVVPVDTDSFEKIVFEDLECFQTKLAIEQRLAAVNLIPEEEADGEFNSLTANAIKVFQRVSKLEETGELDFYTALKIADYEYKNLEKVIDVQMEEALKYFE